MPDWTFMGAVPMRAVALFILLVAKAASAQAPETLSLEEFQRGGPAPAELLLLGTFHFKDAGLDGYRPEVDVDILSPQRQREVEDVVDRLAAFKPTKVMLEMHGPAVERLHQEYRQYLDGEFELGANEIYQLGFRLGKRLGLARLHYVDAPGRLYEQYGSREEWMAYYGQCGELDGDNPWEARFTALYRHGDLAKATQTLRETLLETNREDRILAGHGHYTIGFHAIQCQDKYPGADHLTGWWYNRNIRIFSTIRALTTVPDDRVLLIIGSGHLPILRHLAQASPEYRLREVAEFLGAE